MATNLELYRGVTYPVVYQHTDGNGNKLSLVGATVFFTVKSTKYDEDASDTSAVYKVTVTSHTDAPNGLSNFNVLIPATGIKPGKFFYDIVVKDSTGIELPPVIIGDCKILGKRTNRYA